MARLAYEWDRNYYVKLNLKDFSDFTGIRVVLFSFFDAEDKRHVATVLNEIEI